MEDSQSILVDALFRQNATASIFLLATKVEMASRNRCLILQLTKCSHPVSGPLRDGIALGEKKKVAALSPRPWLV
jgi:hypothetical protein